MNRRGAVPRAVPPPAPSQARAALVIYVGGVTTAHKIIFSLPSKMWYTQVVIRIAQTLSAANVENSKAINIRTSLWPKDLSALYSGVGCRLGPFSFLQPSSILYFGPNTFCYFLAASIKSLMGYS